MGGMEDLIDLLKIGIKGRDKMYLEGENIKPRTVKEAKNLIGEDVEYLQNEDIDKSGRGYFFPKVGTVEDAFGKTIVVSGRFLHRPNIVEMILFEGRKNGT